jgi:hypothetical protein
MNPALVERIVKAVLYEGYLLYPYRTSALKNRQRLSFGVIEPGSHLMTEVLIAGDAPAVTAELRYLDAAGMERRRPIAAATEMLQTGVWKCRVVVDGVTEPISSVHLVLTLTGGDFISSQDPGEEFAAQALACRNEGLWPVLVGAQGERDTMLCSPIILYDYPQVAPESAGDLFDSTEIDEILSLRILTLTDDEKAEIREGDDRARRILERTESLPPEHWMKLHGAIRGLRKGARVRLRPRRGADIMDIVLAGKTAVIESIERDFEDKIHVAVVLEDDPGRDLGELRQPGHRFFFSAEEVELEP